MTNLKLDEQKTAAALETFLSDKLRESGLAGYILGLSGGIDSSLSARICASAVGPDKIFGLIMPYRSSSKESVTDAKRVAEGCEFASEVIEISPMIDAYYSDINLIDRVRVGNKLARERMSILFDKAFEKNCLVLGTSNRTEISLGYGTWYGDVASSVNPIGMLYKTQVRQMARYYDLPSEILKKKPSADLWPGQTDEEELKLDYETVDELLYKLIEQKITNRTELNRAGFEDDFINRTVALVNLFYFKRHPAEIADLGFQPIPDKIIIG